MPISPLDFLDPQVRSLLQGNAPHVPTGIPRNLLKLMGQDQPDDLSPEDERSILGTAGNSLLSGLQYVGSTLDKPGAAVRGLLAGEPGQLANLIPFSDALGITDPQTRVSGRDVLEKWGALAPNTPGFDAGDVAGFAADVLLDPLTYLPGGLALKAVGPAGRIAKQAGLLKGAIKEGVKLGKGVRETLQSTTLRNIFNTASEAGRASLTENAAKAGHDIGDLLDKPLGGVLGATWKPMGHAQTTFSNDWIAKQADKAGEWLKYGNPVGRGVIRAFNEVGGAKTPWMMKRVAGDLIPDVNAAELAGRREQLGALYDLAPKWQTPENQAKIGSWFENRAPRESLLPDEQAAYDVFAKQKALNDASYAARIAAGNQVKTLNDPTVDYVAGSIMEGLGGAGGRGGAIHSTSTANEMGRLESLKGILGGKESIKQIITDPQVVEAIKAGGAVKDVAKMLEGKFARLIPDLPPPTIPPGTPPDWAAQIVNDTAKESAAARSQHFHTLAGQMIHRWPQKWIEEGIPFGSPSATTMTGHVANRVALARAKNLLKSVGEVVTGQVPKFEDFPFFPQGDYVDPLKYTPVAKILKLFKMNGARARETLLRTTMGDEQWQLAKDTLEPRQYAQLTREVGKWRIPQELADDITNVEQNLRGPDALITGMGKVKSLNALSKALWLATPRFHTRNLIGGVLEGEFQGHYSGPFDAFFGQRTGAALAAGKMIPGLEELPAIQRMVADAGLELNNANANRVMQIDVAARAPGRSHFATDVGTELAGGGRMAPDVADPILAEMIGGIPGKSPSSIRSAFSAFKGPWLSPKEEGGNVISRFIRKQSEVRGNEGLFKTRAGGAVKNTESPIVKASEAISRNVEERNRVGAALSLIKKGWQPDAAWEAVGKAQIEYGPRNYSKFERQVMSQLFPFYKFCVPPDHEILTKQGWKQYHELAIGEIVMGYDIESNQLRWEPLEAINLFEHVGELIEYKNRSATFTFTDKHRWPVKRKACVVTNSSGTYEHDERIKWQNGDNLKTGSRLLGQAEWREEANSILSPRHAAILGWVLTDGYHRWRGNHCEMVVYQSPQKHLRQIVELLGTKPGKPHPDSGVVCVPVALADVRTIIDAGFTGKNVSTIVGSLSRLAAEAMFSAMWDGKGTCIGHNHSTRLWIQSEKNQDVIDAFHMLCVITCRAFTTTIQQTNNGVAVFQVNIRRSNGFGINKNFLKKIPYAGLVWCPTTPSGAWVMRHNGAAVITGNSKGKGQDVLAQLAERPGGPHAQIIKASGQMSSNDPGLPDQFRTSLSIPIPEGTPLIGPEPGGDPRYLTGLGLMHEQPLQLLGSNMWRQIGSQLSPAAKYPIEMITRETLSQPASDLGGRSLEDTDPLLGRLAANVSDTITGGKTQRVQPVGDVGFENLVANSPFAAWLSQARVAADPRKNLATRLANLASGLRLSDVSPGARDAVIRDALNKVMKDQGGALEFSKVYFPKEMEALMSPQELATAHQMELLQTILAKRATARKKARLLQEAGGK